MYLNEVPSPLNITIFIMCASNEICQAYSSPDTTVTTSSSSLEDTVATEEVQTDTENAPDSTVDEKDLQSKVKIVQTLMSSVVYHPLFQIETLPLWFHKLLH